MMHGLTKRHREALKRLRSECDFEDHRQVGTVNYVHPGSLGRGIGEGTMSDLVNAGLVETGSHWRGGKGYRISAAGREMID